VDLADTGLVQLPADTENVVEMLRVGTSSGDPDPKRVEMWKTIREGFLNATLNESKARLVERGSPPQGVQRFDLSIPTTNEKVIVVHQTRF